MPGQIAVKDYFNFTGGLNTEGGFLNTPENSFKEGYNVIPQVNGSIRRRPALTVENGGTYTTTAYTNYTELNSVAQTTWKWTAVNGDGDVEFAVMQQGYILYIYNITAGTTISANYIGFIDMSLWRCDYNQDFMDYIPIQCTSLFGQLLVTSQAIDPIIIKYNEDTVDFTTSRITIKIRDFQGVYQDPDPTLEKTPAEWEALGLAGAAYYNLYNQGWDATKISAYQTANSQKLPANTKQWIFGKDASDNFSAASLNKQDFGSSPAPKGRYVIEAFNQQRAVSGVVTNSSNNISNWQDKRIFTGAAVGASDYDVYDNFIPYRPRACTYFAGRAWYAGLPSGTKNGYVYFSQVTNDPSKLGLCYQQNDPTAEVISDLVDSDGGYLVIADVGEIVAMRAGGSCVIVFGSNGIWTITGGQSGFTAASYVVNKVSNVGVLSSQSIVEVEDIFMYWASTGVYALQVDNTGSGKSENMSDNQIKTYYSAIPLACRRDAVGAYNKIDRRVEWVHSTTSSTVLKDKSLLFDLRLKCWFPYDFATQSNGYGTNPDIFGLFAPSDMTVDSDWLVYAGPDQVLTGASGLDEVAAPAALTVGNTIPIKYVLGVRTGSEVITYKLAFGDMSGTLFLDFGNDDPGAWFSTGYALAPTGPSRQKTANYCTFFMEKTETALDGNGDPDFPSGAYIRTKWDFTDNDYSNKWSAQYQIYRQPRPYMLEPSTTQDDGHPVVIYKHKIRGRGRALQYRIDAESGKDMRILGWSTNMLGNQV